MSEGEGKSHFFAWMRHLNRAQRAQLDAASEALAAQEKIVETRREEMGLVDQPSPTRDAIEAASAAVDASKQLLDAQEKQITSIEEAMLTQWAWINWWKF